MNITDREELRSVAQHRWSKQYFTKARKRWFMVIVLFWMISTMILLSIGTTVFVGMTLFAIGYLIAWRWKRKIHDTAIEGMVKQYEREVPNAQK